jgi:hypothetical protein
VVIILNKAVEYEWQMYRTNVLTFLTELKPEYFISKRSASASDVQTIIMLVWTELKDIENAKDAFKVLKLHIKGKQLEVLRTRFRSYKYRSKNKRKTVVVSEFIRQRLTDAMKSINSESVDECLDYLMSELYVEHRDEVVTAIRDNVYGDEDLALNSLLLRLSERDRKILKCSIEESFVKGWDSAKRSRSKNAGVKLIAMGKYIKDLFRLGELK